MFQLANPKAWMLVAAVAAASLAAAQPLPLTLAAALVAALSATCLLVWAMAGATLARSLADRSRRRFLNRGMGLMLIASAPLLLI